MLLMMTACDSSDDAKSGGGGGKYAWVLVDTVDHNSNLEYTSTENKDAEFTYKFEYSRGSYSVRSVYIGRTFGSFNTKYVNGEAYAARCDFSEPPKVIGVGEAVALDVSMTETENSVSGWPGIVHCYAKFTGAEAGIHSSSSEDVHFKDNTNSEGNSRQTLDTSEGISSVKARISAVPPERESGDRIALTITYNISALAVGTSNIYELKKQ